MVKKISKEEFVLKANIIHNNTYDYSKFEYVNNKTKGIIICKIHGEFYQRPNDHLSGKECKTCGYTKSFDLARIENKKNFFQRATKIHNGKYDYSNFEYINKFSKGEIICPIHGVFLQVACEHLSGSGCPSCSGCKRKTTEEFIVQANQIHNNKYDYSKFKYVNNITNGIIICPFHGEFSQIPTNHLAGSGCLPCGTQQASEKIMKSQEEFIEQASKIHNNKYDYSRGNYTGIFNNMEIICPIHGKFEQIPNNHLRGADCPKCARIEANEKLTKSTEEFIEQARKVHGDKYDYSKSIYTGAHDKLIIICPVHKEFKQNPSNHLFGSGCRSCSMKPVSKISQMWLDGLKVPARHREKTIVINGNKYITDAFVPEINTIYEFYGDYWHGNLDKFDKDKMNVKKGKTFGELYQETIKREEAIKNDGYEVISIWENDFITSRKI